VVWLGSATEKLGEVSPIQDRWEPIRRGHRNLTSPGGPTTRGAYCAGEVCGPISWLASLIGPYKCRPLRKERDKKSLSKPMSLPTLLCSHVFTMVVQAQGVTVLVALTHVLSDGVSPSTQYHHAVREILNCCECTWTNTCKHTSCWHVLTTWYITKC